MDTATDIDLTRFCGGGHSRYGTPFVRAGWRYATDRRICVRVPAPDEANNGPTHPDVAAIFANALAGAPSPWPTDGLSTDIDACSECDGKGTVGKLDCPDCDGEGEIDCPHCGQDMTCRTCDGRRTVGDIEDCPVCAGTSNVPFGRLVGGKWIGPKYDNLIRALPNVRFWEPAGEKGMVSFEFDGGEGRVMEKLK